MVIFGLVLLWLVIAVFMYGTVIGSFKAIGAKVDWTIIMLAMFTGVIGPCTLLESIIINRQIFMSGVHHWSLI